MSRPPYLDRHNASRMSRTKAGFGIAAALIALGIIAASIIWGKG